MAQHLGPKHLVERRREVAGIDVTNSLVEVEDSDTVHQRVESVEGVHRGGDRQVVGCAGGRIAFDYWHLLQLVAQRVAFVWIPFEHSNFCTFITKGIDDGPADAGAAAHDQRTLPAQPAGHGSTPSSGSSGAPALPTIAASVRAFCRVSASTSSASKLIHRPDLGAQISSRDPFRVSTRRTTTSVNSFATVSGWPTAPLSNSIRPSFKGTPPGSASLRPTRRRGWCGGGGFGDHPNTPTRPSFKGPPPGSASLRPTRRRGWCGGRV